MRQAAPGRGAGQVPPLLQRRVPQAPLQAEERARTAEERAAELEHQLADVTAVLATAEARAEAAEEQAAQAAALGDNGHEPGLTF